MSKDKVENPEANELVTNCDRLAMPIEKLIHPIRGQQVMLDSDLAKLYDVETRAFRSLAIALVRYLVPKTICI